jgi:hypothetical protein
VNYAKTADVIPTKLSHAELDAALKALVGELPPEQQDKFTAITGIVATTTDFFTAPASAKFHLNEEYGLYKHSLGVTYRLCALDAAYDIFSEYGHFEVLLCGLLHDLGKAGQVSLVEVDESVDLRQVRTGEKFYHSSCEPYYVKRALKTRPGDFEYRRNPERVGMSIPVSSLHFIGTLLGDYWKPSLAAWQAVCYHDGMYVPEGEHTKHAETKLLLALHHADMFQSRTEGGWATGSGWFG